MRAEGDDGDESRGQWLTSSVGVCVMGSRNVDGVYGLWGRDALMGRSPEASGGKDLESNALRVLTDTEKQYVYVWICA